MYFVGLPPLEISSKCFSPYFILASSTWRRSPHEMLSYPKQNELTKVLIDIGLIERTLLILDWVKSGTKTRKISATAQAV
jgi:hypothetical protein